MPTYVYYYLDSPDSDERLEIWQPMKDDALTECPITGRAVKRVMCNTNRFRSNENLLSDGKLASNGFAKYVKSGDGTYELAAGSDGTAPQTLDANTVINAAKQTGKIP